MLYIELLAALRNATARFSLSEVEKDCIASHMWPSAGQKPRFAESKIVNLADKICATAEVLHIYHLMRIRRQLLSALLQPQRA